MSKSEEYFIEVPMWDNGVWTTTKFETREEFKSFILSLYSIPGKYNFDETTELFNEQAKTFHRNALKNAGKGFYTDIPTNSQDYFKYWGTLKNEYALSEKSKCRNGVIFKNKNNTYYLTRDYYFWINFLPIFDKDKKKFDFPEVWDSQYHMALYELLAELDYKHIAILKKRQFGSSYFHMSKLINQFWFEEGRTCKIGASLKDYINEKGCWKFLNEYKNFLNTNTGWYRNTDPAKVLLWQQRQQIKIGNKDSYDGNMSVLAGNSFDTDPTAGVGGNITYFYHEEAGIAPKMNITYEYIRPALSSGMVTTGTFIAAGSVGDLDQCQPLKKMMLDPVTYSIYSVETNLIDDKQTIGLSGLFIPEQWSMPPFIDKYGNSLVEEALAAILEERKEWKKKLDPGTYQLRISQKPINIHEAFAYRKESVFPLGLINKQIQRIENREYSIEYVDLVKDTEGKVKAINSNKSPIEILGSAIKSLEDKTGVICMYERPLKEKPDFGMYYASVDPVKEGKSTTSESLCTIIVYKTVQEIAKITGNTIDNYLERDKIVMTWAGRFDDLKKTHERLELIIEYYNAWTIVEKNVSEFTTYMQNRKKQHMLVPRNQLLGFNKDQKGVSEAYQEYGWNNSPAVFSHLLSYGISYLKEELDQTLEQDGTITDTKYGIERIPDIMLLREMAAYEDGKGNYDRLVAFVALVAFATMQNANRGYFKRTEKVADLEKPNKFSKFIMGGPEPKKPNPWAKPTGAFRNVR